MIGSDAPIALRERLLVDVARGDGARRPVDLEPSHAEIQELADQILERLGVRLGAGLMVIHFNEGRVQRVETRTYHACGGRGAGSRVPEDR